MQSGIHRWINGIQPHGWEYQVKNDAVLNYEVSYEKALISVPGYFLANAYGAARVGTISDKLSMGGTIMGGLFHSPYNEPGKQRKTQLYLYVHPQIDAVGYDATLQGGPFSDHDPYTISKDQVSRLVLQAHGGIVLQYRKLYLEYEQSIIGKEFITGSTHRTGGIQIGVNW
jgi:hypothetical protein